MVVQLVVRSLVELLNEALRLFQEEEVDGGPGVDGGGELRAAEKLVIMEHVLAKYNKVPTTAEPAKVEIAAEVNTRNINCKIQERKYGGENWKPYTRPQLRPIESGSSL
nr:hypothetical protein Itr_chr14CG21810 [Ipomoea trifida]